MTVDKAEGQPGRKPKGRSPSYPGISLDKAIVRAKQLWSKEKQYPTPINVVTQMWGYAGTTGTPGLVVAALKKFGLLVEEGANQDRRVRVTDVAVVIINHPSTIARAEAIQAAALTPAIHREMWDLYGKDLPSDANIEWMLTKERGFTDTGASEFVKQYRQTIDFAGLLDHDTMAAETLPDDDLEDDDSGVESTPVDAAMRTSDAAVEDPFASTQPSAIPAPSDSVTTAGSALLTRGREASRPIVVPLGGTVEVLLGGSFPLTEDEWNLFIAVLNAMKPGLTQKPEA